MKRMLGVVMAVFVLGLVTLICLPVHAQEEAIELNFAGFSPPASQPIPFFSQYCEEVSKRTNGRVKVTLFPGGILSSGAQMHSSVLKGIADIGYSFTAYTKGRFPVTDILTMPMGCKDPYIGGNWANALYKKFKPSEFDDVKIFWLFNGPPQQLFGKKPFRTLEDLKGVKFRAGGGVEAKLLRALGAVPVALTPPEVYDALDKGVVDGFSGAYVPANSYKLFNILSYCTEYDAHLMGAGYVIMNKEKWDSIGPDDQRIIDEINEEYSREMGRMWIKVNAADKDTFLQTGGKVIVLSKEENALWAERYRPIVDDYVKELNSKGLPGDEILKFSRDYLKTFQE